MSLSLTRRAFCGQVGAALTCAVLPPGKLLAGPERPQGLTLGIGNYGMPGLTVEEAIRLIAASGFDSLELSLMPDWDSAPTRLNQERRKSIRQMLSDKGLTLTSLMEDIPPSAVATEHQATLERLKRAADLAHDLAPERPPLIQTVLGGGTWNERKALLVDRVGDWLRTAESSQTVIAVKPHRSGAMSQPRDAAWLYEQLGKSRWLGMVYDYSHYAMRDLSIAETVATALPLTVQIAVKDVKAVGDRTEFALPGEVGTVDYSEILTRFHDGGYRGDVCCEVSSQVFRRPGYDPVAATQSCAKHLQQAFAAAHIPRRKRVS
ncbi:MAG: sugar phosphate isomerase/epimerase [Planctomycetes bacterium]|nr:sugar phosphate isomerase/epimerase [Planctomycetota bacterium]